VWSLGIDGSNAPADGFNPPEVSPLPLPTTLYQIHLETAALSSKAEACKTRGSVLQVPIGYNRGMGVRFNIRSLSPVRWSLVLSIVLVFLDAVLDGSYLFSALVCPIWLVVALFRAGSGRATARVAIARILIPVVTGAIVFANFYIQDEIAMANAARIIQACESYREDNGAYPEKLGDVVPRYLGSIPPAKYCGSWHEFWYFGSPAATLSWVQVPPFGRKVYNFVTGEWRYID